MKLYISYNLQSTQTVTPETYGPNKVHSLVMAHQSIKTENRLTYPLAPVILSLRCLDGTIRKSCKSSVIDTCFLDLAAYRNIIESLFHNS